MARWSCFSQEKHQLEVQQARTRQKVEQRALRKHIANETQHDLRAHESIARGSETLHELFSHNLCLRFSCLDSACTIVLPAPVPSAQPLPCAPLRGQAKEQAEARGKHQASLARQRKQRSELQTTHNEELKALTSKLSRDVLSRQERESRDLQESHEHELEVLEIDVKPSYRNPRLGSESEEEEAVRTSSVGGLRLGGRIDPVGGSEQSQLLQRHDSERLMLQTQHEKRGRKLQKKQVCMQGTH